MVWLSMMGPGRYRPGRVEVMSKKWTGSELAIVASSLYLDLEYLVRLLFSEGRNVVRYELGAAWKQDLISVVRGESI